MWCFPEVPGPAASDRLRRGDPAGVLLVALSRGVTAHIASALFVLSLLALFGASGTYHMSHWPPAIKARLQRLDHAMIFVLIAGSYTPVTLLALDPAWGITFLVLAWGIAAGGAILALWHIRIIHRYAAFLYIGFGWLLVLALPAVLRPGRSRAHPAGHRRRPVHVGRHRLVAAHPEPEPEELRLPRGLARDDTDGRGLSLRWSCCSCAARPRG